jgi:pilus assembly protein CpaB
MEGIMGRRSVLLVVALVIAAIGTTMVFIYVSNVNDQAIAKQKPVKVLVAKKPIAPGTTYKDASDQASFEKKTVSRDDLVDGALGSTDPLVGKVTTTAIYAGQQIIPQMFGDTGEVSTLSVPADMLAMSVQLDDPAQVAGFVEAGTNVAIFLTSPVAKRGGGDETQLLLPSVKVLAIGNQTAVPQDTTTTGTEEASVPKTILTIAVTQADYQRVLFGSTHGKLNLGLPGKDFKPNETLPPTNESNLFTEN